MGDIIYEKNGKAAWIILNRPEVNNAQNNALRQKFIGALEIASADSNPLALSVLPLLYLGETAKM